MSVLNTHTFVVKEKIRSKDSQFRTTLIDSGAPDVTIYGTIHPNNGKYKVQSLKGSVTTDSMILVTKTEFDITQKGIEYSTTWNGKEYVFVGSREASSVLPHYQYDLVSTETD